MEVNIFLFTKKRYWNKIKGENEEEEEDEKSTQRYRKQLPAKRLVNSIETSLDIRNYKPLVLREITTSYTTIMRESEENYYNFY